MLHKYLNLLLVAWLPIIIACRPKSATPLRVQWLSMGTTAAIQCAHHKMSDNARQLTAAIFEYHENEFSVWQTNSALSWINHTAGQGKPLAITPLFNELLTNTLEICRRSDGAFNPLIGPVMQAWGFNGASPKSTVPNQTILTELAPLIDWRAIILNHQATPATLYLPKSGMLLDMGAIAKGYAVDAAWTSLQAAGYTNILIDLGGNLRALGEAAPKSHGWRTGVRNPFDKQMLIARFLLRDGEAVATSGNYERFVDIHGTRYAHILDPRTLTPVSGVASVTVTAPNATLADALSTTLFVLGPERGARLLNHYPACEALWIPDTPDNLTIIATGKIADRLNPIKSIHYKLTVITL